jgi:hypothetical protein
MTRVTRVNGVININTAKPMCVTWQNQHLNYKNLKFTLADEGQEYYNLSA